MVYGTSIDLRYSVIVMVIVVRVIVVMVLVVRVIVVMVI